MFEIYQSPKNKQFYFRLKAANHQTILISEGYRSKASCRAGIRSVANNATKDSSFEIRKAKNGKFHFHLVAKNGEIIGSSQLYKAKASAKRGISSVKANGTGAEVRDLSA